MLPAQDLVTLPPPPVRRIRTVGTGMVGATGPTGPQGGTGFSLAGAVGAVGVTGCVVPVSTVGSGPVGPTGPTGYLGATGATGPVNLNGDAFGLRAPSEARIVARYSGSPREVLGSVLRALRHLGHAWQVTGGSAVCDRCLSSVSVDPLPCKPGFRTTSREVGVRTVGLAEDGTPITLPRYARRLRSSRLPRPSHLRDAAASYPSCSKARQLLVDRVHDM
jgi:hypothetical protein